MDRHSNIGDIFERRVKHEKCCEEGNKIACRNPAADDEPAPQCYSQTKTDGDNEMHERGNPCRTLCHGHIQLKNIGKQTAETLYLPVLHIIGGNGTIS